MYLSKKRSHGIAANSLNELSKFKQQVKKRFKASKIRSQKRNKNTSCFSCGSEDHWARNCDKPKKKHGWIAASKINQSEDIKSIVLAFDLGITTDTRKKF